jgi:hypothetical protein
MAKFRFCLLVSLPTDIHLGMTQLNIMKKEDRIFLYAMFVFGHFSHSCFTIIRRYKHRKPKPMNTWMNDGYSFWSHARVISSTNIRTGPSGSDIQLYWILGSNQCLPLCSTLYGFNTVVRHTQRSSERRYVPLNFLLIQIPFCIGYLCIDTTCLPSQYYLIN